MFTTYSMKLLVLSDIHGNYPALSSVEDDVDWSSIDSVLCLGDTVGYGPYPRKCVEWVQENCDIVLQGNHDRDFPFGYFENQRNDIYESRQLALDELSSDQVSWLQDLPQKTEITSSILAVHSHPKETLVDTHVRPKDFPSLVKFIENYKMLLIGHTHIQAAKHIDGKIILNPGSVGQPRDYEYRASYGIIDTDSYEYSLHRVDYNISAVKNRSIELDQPPKNWKRLYK